MSPLTTLHNPTPLGKSNHQEYSDVHPFESLLTSFTYILYAYKNIIVFFCTFKLELYYSADCFSRQQSILEIIMHTYRLG